MNVGLPIKQEVNLPVSTDLLICIKMKIRIKTLNDLPLEIFFVFLCLFDMSNNSPDGKIIHLMMKEFKFKPTIQNTKPLKLKITYKRKSSHSLVQSDTVRSLSFFSKDYTLIVSVLGSAQIWHVCAVMSSLNINQTNE